MFKYIYRTNNYLLLGQKRKHCGECKNCKRDDSGICKFCKDKTKFGGGGKLKEAMLWIEEMFKG